MNAREPIVPVLNIIGPVGIGKSSVADAISEILESEYMFPHAVVDLDHVRRASPTPTEDPFHMELGFKNLAALWNNYQSVGAKCLIVPSVMESTEHLDKLRLSVPGADVFVVRLVASLEVNHARIRGRETDADSLNWHLRRSTQLARELAEKKLEDIIVDTDSKETLEIGREIIAQWESLSQNWRCE